MSRNAEIEAPAYDASASQRARDEQVAGERHQHHHRRQPHKRREHHKRVQQVRAEQRDNRRRDDGDDDDVEQEQRAKRVPGDGQAAAAGAAMDGPRHRQRGEAGDDVEVPAGITHLIRHHAFAVGPVHQQLQREAKRLHANQRRQRQAVDQARAEAREGHQHAKQRRWRPAMPETAEAADRGATGVPSPRRPTSTPNHAPAPMTVSVVQRRVAPAIRPGGGRRGGRR